MAKRITVSGTILLVGLALGACQSAGPPPPAPPPPPPAPVAPGLAPEGLHAGTPPEVNYIFLSYIPELPPPDCIGIYDDPVTIWMGSPPSRVEWQVRDKAENTQWVIEYDAEKDEANQGASLLPGRIVIPCGRDAAYRSARPRAKGRWPYRVSVFECTGGQPNPEPACVRDPGVIIWE